MKHQPILPLISSSKKDVSHAEIQDKETMLQTVTVIGFVGTISKKNHYSEGRQRALH